MLNINTLALSKDGNHVDYWAKFQVENESITCTFVHDGEKVHKIHNIKSTLGYGTIGMIAYLYNKDNACKELNRIIESSNKSKHSPLKGLKVLHG